MTPDILLTLAVVGGVLLLLTTACKVFDGSTEPSGHFYDLPAGRCQESGSTKLPDGRWERG